MDFNLNGTFEAAEGISYTVPTNAAVQTLTLTWTGVPSVLVDNSITYLRIRITSATNAMTVSNPTGWFADGEVEDHRVVVTTSPLASNAISFSASKLGENKVQLSWNVHDEEAGASYEVQRSNNGIDWKTITSRTAVSNIGLNTYNAFDESPLKPVSYYRLKINDVDGEIRYSNNHKLTFELKNSITIQPNPAHGFTNVIVNTTKAEQATVRLFDMNGKAVWTQSVRMPKGANLVPVQLNHPSGLYTVQVSLSDAVYTEKLMIK
jgi:hypothetical protein